MVKRFQNRIAESRSTLPVVSVLGVAICLLSGLVEEGLWAQLAVLACGTMGMVMLNNAHALLRIFSRSVSCLYLMLTLAAGFLFPSLQLMVVQVCFVAFLFLLFYTYQDPHAAGRTYYAFLMIGLASLFFPQVLFLVPVFWLVMAIGTLSLGVHTFLASVLAIATPYWFAAVYLFIIGEVSRFADHFGQLADFSPVADFSGFTSQWWMLFILLLLFAFTGGVHFARQSYHDNIKQRQFFWTFILLAFVLVVFVILQPSLFEPLSAMLIVVTAPLFGHFVSLTHTRFTNWATMASMAAIVLLVLYGLLQKYGAFGSLFF